MLATCRKSSEIPFHDLYMRIIPPTREQVLAHVRDTCIKLWGIRKCKFDMLITCRNASKLKMHLFVHNCTYRHEQIFSNYLRGSCQKTPERGHGALTGIIFGVCQARAPALPRKGGLLQEFLVRTPGDCNRNILARRPRKGGFSKGQSRFSA